MGHTSSRSASDILRSSEGSGFVMGESLLVVALVGHFLRGGSCRSDPPFLTRFLLASTSLSLQRGLASCAVVLLSRILLSF